MFVLHDLPLPFNRAIYKVENEQMNLRSAFGKPVIANSPARLEERT